MMCILILCYSNDMCTRHHMILIVFTKLKQEAAATKCVAEACCTYVLIISTIIQRTVQVYIRIIT